MLMVKQSRPAIRTLHGWAISTLRDIQGPSASVSTTAGCKTEQILTRATAQSRRQDPPPVCSANAPPCP